MKKTGKIIGIITATVLVSLMSTVSVQATSGDSTTKVYVVTNENLTAYFDGVAGGDINYWIDGIEVKGEFETLRNALGEFIDVWIALNNLKSDLEETNDTANDAYSYADQIYNYTQDNAKKLEEHNQTLILYYHIINSTINELVAFEKAGGLFLTNRHYPLRDVIKNGKGIFGTHGKQQRIRDSVHKIIKGKSKG